MKAHSGDGHSIMAFDRNILTAISTAKYLDCSGLLMQNKMLVTMWKSLGHTNARPVSTNRISWIYKDQTWEILFFSKSSLYIWLKWISFTKNTGSWNLSFKTTACTLHGPQSRAMTSFPKKFEWKINRRIPDPKRGRQSYETEIKRSTIYKQLHTWHLQRWSNA